MFSWTFVQNKAGTLLIGRYTGEADNNNKFDSHTRKQIASFDLDSTLIETKSGKLHALDSTDWKWWHSIVTTRLRTLFSQGHNLIVFTNQGRLTTATGTEAPESLLFKAKLEAIGKDLGVPFTVYAACANDSYRKPRTGMWDVMCGDFGLRELRGQRTCGKGRLREVRGEVEVDALLVGDAAGRDRDHSDFDKHFSENLGIPFFTPEEFFLGDKTQVLGHKFDPSWYLPSSLGGSSNSKPTSKITLELAKAELLVLVGLPGAGKTTYYRNFLQPLGYERVNQYALGGFGDSVKAAEQFLAEGKSNSFFHMNHDSKGAEPLDDINSHPTVRKIWVSTAQKHGIQAAAFNFTAPVDLCLHNDSVRALGGPLMNLEQRGIFARMPFRKLQASFQRPQISEGFMEVVDVDFEWTGSDDQLKIWRRHWL